MKTFVIALLFATARILTATAATAATTTNSGTGGFELPSQTCLVPAATPVVGTHLQVGGCSSPSATRFTLAPSDSGSKIPTAQGTIAANGLCLDAATGTPTFNNCNLNPSQEWTWLPASTALQSVSTRRCVSAAGFTAGSSVSLAGCQSGLDSQAFTPINFNMMFVSGIVSPSPYFGPNPAYLPPNVTPGIIAGNVGDIQCLDTLLDFETLPNDPIDDFQCNATNAQWYHFTAGRQLESEANTCVTATAGSAGAAVNMEACNGSTGQQWAYVAGHLLSALDATKFAAAYCLDVRGESGTSLTPVVVNNCGTEVWPLGQYWWGNLIWPSNAVLQATQQLGGPSVYANVQLTLDKAGQFTMTPTVQNHDQVTGFTYTLTCNIGAFAVGYQGSVDEASLFEIHGPGVDTPGTFGVFDTGIVTDWAALSSLWSAGPGNPQFGCQLNETSNLSQTVQNVSQVVASVALEELMVDPSTGGLASVSCVTSGQNLFTCGTDPRSCLISGNATPSGPNPPPSDGADLDCEVPDSVPGE